MRHPLLTLVAFCLGLLAAAVPLPAEPIEQRPMMRAMWVNTWSEGILSAAQIDELVAALREANLNAVFPEVRRIGDAYYLNGLEPRATNIEGPPEFDPLQYLIDRCHDTADGKAYIEVHAWMVTFRVGRGKEEALPEGHMLRVHPEAIMRDAQGNALGTNDTLFADPGHPATQEWTARVFRDVAARYAVDGVHHDYVRYPEYDGDWGHNPKSLERFRARTGLEGTPAPDDPAWRAWRREQVAAVVRRVYAEVWEARPACLVSAATLNWGLEVDPWSFRVSSPRLSSHQDWPQYVAEGSLDLNCVMNYAQHGKQPLRFKNWAELALRFRGDRHAIIGPGAYINTVDDTLAEIRTAAAMGADGVIVYSWNGTNNERVPRADFMRRLREEVFTQPVPQAPRPWKESPRYGGVIGQCTDAAGAWLDGAQVLLDGVHAQLTDGTGFFAFLRVDPGRHVVTLRTAEGQTLRAEVTVEPGRPARANFQLTAP